MVMDLYQYSNYGNDNCVNWSMLANLSFVMHYFCFGVRWFFVDNSQTI